MFLFKILLILFINLNFPLTIHSTKSRTAEKRLLTLVNGDPFYDDYEPRNFRLTLYHRHRPLFLKKYKRQRVILFHHRHFHHHVHQNLNNRVRVIKLKILFELSVLIYFFKLTNQIHQLRGNRRDVELLNQRLRDQNELLANELEESSANESLQLNRNSAPITSQPTRNSEETKISRSYLKSGKKRRKESVD